MLHTYRWEDKVNCTKQSVNSVNHVRQTDIKSRLLIPVWREKTTKGTCLVWYQETATRTCLCDVRRLLQVPACVIWLDYYRYLPAWSQKTTTGMYLCYVRRLIQVCTCVMWEDYMTDASCPVLSVFPDTRCTTKDMRMQNTRSTSASHPRTGKRTSDSCFLRCSAKQHDLTIASRYGHHTTAWPHNHVTLWTPHNSTTLWSCHIMDATQWHDVTILSPYTHHTTARCHDCVTLQTSEAWLSASQKPTQHCSAY